MAEETLTHWKQLVNTDYIGAYMLQPGEEKVVEIMSVGKGKVKGSDGKEKECTIATLKNEKPFILNRTNCKTLTKVFSTPYIEGWKGKRIIVFAENVKAFGEQVEALRIRPYEPILPPLTPDSPKWPGAIAALQKNTTTIETIEKSYSISPDHKKQLLTAIKPNK